MNQNEINNNHIDQQETNNEKKYTFKEVLTTITLFSFYVVRGIVLFFIPKKLLYKDVRGLNVLITGAGSGLGQGLSVRFARLGANIVGVDLSMDGLNRTQELVEKEGGQFHSYICDISKPDEVYKMGNQVEREVGFISILVNNAGVVTGKMFLNTDEKDIYKTFNVNAYANFWNNRINSNSINFTDKAFLPAMRERNFGHLVTVSSMAGLTGAVQLVDYCASKFAAVGFIESLRYELVSEGFDNIKTTCICPFFIHTGMFKGTKSRFIPILEPDYAVDKIMSAILTNQKLLIMPRIFYFMLFFRSCLPADACDYIYDKIGGNSMMSNFVGRQKVN